MDTPVSPGFDSYSLRAWRWKATQLIDYAASQKLDSIQLSGLADYESFEPAYLAKIREQAERPGIAIDGGIGCICPSSKSNGTPTQYLEPGLKVCKAVGARSMRCYLGAFADRMAPGGIDMHIANTVNHSGDMQARELRTLIEEAGKDYVAACLDTGNPMWVVENPLVTLQVLAPYTVTTHIRDSVVFEHARGAAAQWVALDDGCVDWKAFMAMYRERCPKAVMQLENITGRPPQVLPYLEDSFWRAFPKASAGEFARFGQMVKSGHPLMAPMVVEDVSGDKQPPEYAAALKEQQKRDLEKGFDYAKRVLGAGARWRA